ncbi:MAG: hypothetical protein ACI97X_000970 [Oceanospirillaceae bacterium]
MDYLSGNEFTLKQTLFALCLFAITPSILLAQCNGFQELCGLKYNQVSYLTTHNAFNAGDDGFSVPNQNQGLTGQLNGGVRGFMLDVYDEGGVPTVYHGFAFLGTAPLTSNLTEIKTFLDANPNEVVTIIFESYVDANMMESAFVQVGLLPYMHEQVLGSPWPTLQQMIDAGTQLVVLTDSDDASPTQGWYHYVWEFAVETGFSNNAPSDFSCDFNRGDSINDLFILNHFVTDATVGIGIAAQSEIVNAFDYFYPRAVSCWNEKQKFPNFPTVDFYELGETKRVLDSLNLNPIHLDIESVDSPPFTVETKGNGVYKILFDAPNSIAQIEVYSAIGRLVDYFSVERTNAFTVDLGSEPKGIYMVKVSADKGRDKSIKLLR